MENETKQHSENLEHASHTSTRSPQPSSPQGHPFSSVQRAVGNQAIGKLFGSGLLQTKLQVSQPGDADENEADRVAERVVSRQHAPMLQRKCDCGGSCSKCQEEEGIIHRSMIGRLSSLPLSIQRAAVGAGVERDASRHPAAHPQVLVVEDDAAKVEAGQMRKTQFIALLQTTACATADAALAAVKHTTKGCPYIQKWLGHYQQKSAEHLMRAMHKYAPETVKARSAHEAISLLNQRVEKAALTWAKTGKVSELPEGIQEEMMGGGEGGFLGAVAGFASSGFGKGLLGFLGGGAKPEFSIGGKKEGSESEGEKLQKKSRDGGTAGAHDARAVKEQLGSGQSLDGRVQSQMSSAFGYDFSGVRVHTDSKATELSSQLSARAFTIGADVAFAGGEYKPGTLIGDALIAHELAHVVQQGGGQRAGGAQTKDAGLSDNSSLEQDADRSAVGAVVSAWTGMKNSLSAIGANAPPRLKSGLKLQRCSRSTLPKVDIGHFRNTGSTADSGENNCGLCPKTLGLDAATGENRMELRGDISGHQPAAQYDFKRTKERATWKNVGGVWTQVTKVGPGADDDAHDSDEDLTPQNDHIYVFDEPGFNSMADPIGDATAKEEVYKASFVESANVKAGAGAWTKNSNDFKWHSITWLEKVAGVWRRKAGKNEIETGSTTVGTGNP